MSVKFTDSIDHNLELLGELLRGMPPGAQARAKRAYAQVGAVVNGLRKDNPNDPAVIVGTTLAVYSIAQQMVQTKGDETQTQGENLIHLLN